MRKFVSALTGLLFCLHCQASDKRFTVISIDSNKEALELFHIDEGGNAFKNFKSLAAWLKKRNLNLEFAMNAGMFQKDFSPVGLLVINGRQLSPLNLKNGSGNFYLKPNGVFMLTSAGPQVVDSTDYPQNAAEVKIATQSGPLLVKDGIMHPSFSATSTSKYIRNGVGVSGNKIHFVISEEPVTFYEFAKFFRDDLNCPNALYFDGAVSSLYSKSLNRNDEVTSLGPIIGTVK